jgi:hypothetical protein
MIRYEDLPRHTLHSKNYTGADDDADLSDISNY